MLDAGAGNHLVAKTKEFYVNCKYFGIDKCCDYDNNVEDIKLMDQFYEMDLEELEFDEIPNNYFDIIIVTHVIEHLKNGDKVIEKLLDKLAENGSVFLGMATYK